MKKTQFIDLISTIRKTAVSFVAITVFIALGVACYGGSVWGAAHTENSFTQTCRDGRMRTLLVTDPLGLTEEQVSELKTVDGIDDAEGLNTVYRFFRNSSGVTQLAAVTQITENIDRLMNVEGQLPTAAGETAVLRSWAEANNVAIGDVIVLQEKNAVDYRELRSVRSVAQWDGSDLSALEDVLRTAADDPGYLTETTLTVTAIVNSPAYMATNPYAHGICPANGLYIDAVFFVSKEEMPPEGFGGYTSVALYSEELNRNSSFSNEYKACSKALSESVQEVLDGWDRQLVEDYGASADRLRTQLDLLSGLPSTRIGAAYAEGERLYELLDQTRQELGAQESFSGVTEMDANNAYFTADNLISVLDSMRSVLGVTFLAIGVLICYSVVSRLVADGAVQIGTRKAIGFYRREIMRLYLCYVLAAMVPGGILGLLIGVFGIEYAFTRVFAAQFTFTPIPLVCNPVDILPVFLIICVIILAVTVEACRAETGKSAIALLRGDWKEAGAYDPVRLVQKSRLFRKLSLLNRTVLLNLLRDRRRVFGMLTGIAGAATLITAGMTLYQNFTTAFPKQFQDYYRFDYQICYDASSTAAPDTVVFSDAAVSSNAAPDTGVSFNSASDTAASADSPALTASGEIRRVLDSHGLKYAEIYSAGFILRTPDGKTNELTVIVPADPEELAELMYFDTETEKSVTYDSGLWMGDYYLYAFDAPPGSLLKLQTMDGREAELPVDCYYKYHLSTQVIVMNQTTYREAFGEEAVPNAFYVASDGFDMEQVDEELKDTDGYIYTYNFYESFQASFASEKTVIAAFAVLFILMAVLMALMMLINLMNVYIAEKKNELIILMINGYDRVYAKRYIYADTIALTLTGILIGLVAGSLLGNRTLTAIEGNLIRMLHGVSFSSCAAAAAVTAGLTALICNRTLRQIDSFRLSDIDRGN